jgi:hypothetical protein
MITNRRSTLLKFVDGPLNIALGMSKTRKEHEQS